MDSNLKAFMGILFGNIYRADKSGGRIIRQIGSFMFM
jgi:hypothetical protein